MSSKAPFWILKLGDTVPDVATRLGDFDDWIKRGLGLPERDLRVAQVHRGDPLPSLGEVGALLLSGSAAMVTLREPWSERAAAWLVTAIAAQKPVLGICYGHQLIAQALGGEVGDNPRGREIGTVRVSLADAASFERKHDPLLRGFPDELIVQATHVQSVLRPPADSVALGWNAADDHHVLRFRERVWGVQFHPEFDAEVIRGYLAERGSELESEGLDPVELSAAAADSPHGTQLLRRFAELGAEQPAAC